MIVQDATEAATESLIEDLVREGKCFYGPEHGFTMAVHAARGLTHELETNLILDSQGQQVGLKQDKKLA